MQSYLAELEQLRSEQKNSASNEFDLLPTEELVALINRVDADVVPAVSKAVPNIAKCVDAVVQAFNSGGRLIYIGAGTSGRLGILDAVECRPTFSVGDNLVVGVIAGGEHAIQHAVEGAEDDAIQGAVDLQNLDLTSNDTVVGIAASGRTPYVIGALTYANQKGCQTACITCNPTAKLLNHADIPIVADVGPEVLTGSTRMKSGTAQKLILNMISTASMVKIGKTFGNLMVDVNATNEKLKARAVRIVMHATDCSAEQASNALAEAKQNAKLAILMILTDLPYIQAKPLLDANRGFLRKALQDA